MNKVCVRISSVAGLAAFSLAAVATRLVFAVLLAVLCHSVPAHANLIVNGSFELGAFVNNGDGAMSLDPGPSAITGWTTVNAELAWLDNANVFGLVASDGVKSLDLTGYHNFAPYSGVQQTIVTTPGQLYLLGFDVGGDPIFGASNSVTASAGDASSTFTNDPGQRWQRFGLPFSATSGSTVVSLVGSVAGGIGQDVSLDNVSVSPLQLPPGLVSWWRAEGDATDSQDGNNATLQGNATFAPGKLGQAFSFDGNGDAVLIGNSSSLRLQDFTIAAWIKRASATVASLDESAAPGAGIFSYGQEGYGLGLFDDGRLVVSRIGVDNVSESGLTVTDTASFHHVAVTKSGSTVVFYVDGVETTADAPYDPGFAFTTNAVIGALGEIGPGVVFSNSFFGLIDEVQAYDHALSASEIGSILQNSCIPPPSGLVSWYPMDGSLNDLRNTNTPSASSGVSFVSGEVGQGATFATGGFIDIPDSPSLDRQQITVDAWVRPDGAGPNNDSFGSVIIGKTNSGTDAFSLQWSAATGRFVFVFGNIGSELITSSDTFATGVFYHVAGTYDGATFRLYVNGTPEGSLALAKTITYTASRPWEIGGSSTGVGFPRTWNGVIDEVEIINRALSAAEVAALYGAGSAGKCRPTPILQVQGSSDTSVYAPGSAMQLAASVTLNGAPVSDATVSAAYTAPDNSVQTVLLSNGGSGNVYTGSLSSVGTAQGSNGSVTFTASAGGQTATSVVHVTVTSHNLSFNGPQSFPSSLQQSESGLITVNIENDAYVADPATLQLLDVTDPEAPVTLNQIGIQVPPRTTTASYGLPFNPASMSLGSHTLQVNLLNLPPGESPASVTQLSGTVQIVAAQPSLNVTPQQPTVFTQAGTGSPSPVVLTLANTGPDTTLAGITLALVSRSGGTPYPWVTLTATSVPDLAFNASAQVTVNVQPPAGTIPNAYQDTAVQINTTNCGSIQIPLTVYVDSGEHGSLIFAVSDDSHQAVANATVELLATVPGIASQTLTTDIHGLATFTGVSAGIPFNYSVSAPSHQTGVGSVTLQDASLPQTQPVVLVTQAILTTWTVVPTTITDTYDINLQVTYQTDVPVPQLAIDPGLFAFTANPSAPSGPMLLNNSSVTSGNMTIYNPSQITVNNVVVDASAVQGATVTLTFNGQTGSAVTIPSIPPQSNVVLQYSASAACPSDDVNLASQINIDGQYTYFEITPALSASPSSFGPSSFGADGISENLTISNTGYNIATNITVSTPSNPWITVSQNLGDLGIGNQATLPIVIHPPAGTPPDTYQENLTIRAGNHTPSNTLALTIVVNADGSGTVEGIYSPAGDVPSSTATTSTAVPVRVYSCAAPPPPVSLPIVSPCGLGNICIVYSGPPGGPSPILPPSVPPPPPAPVPMAHEIVQLEIPQTATLERQAFLATLNTTNTTSSELADFQVTISVTDLSGSATNAAGQCYVDLFAITPPQSSGYTGDGGIASGQTGTSQFTLIPSAGLGGTTAAGQQYNVAAIYAYVLNGQPFSETTAPVTITVYPQPQLIINYFVPRQVEANHPVKLGVIVQNVGFGPANNLIISSGQLVMTDNKSGLLVTFALLGAEVGGQPQVQNSLTLNLGTIPGGGTAYGYWLLNADLSGEFTAFTASYTEQPFAGVQLSPLIVAVHTNLIVQGDVVPAGGEDLQIVTQDPSIPPSILLDLETGVEIPVTTIYITDATLATLASPVTTFSVAANGGYVVAVVPDALPSLPIASVHASYPDGSNAELFTGNNLVWRNLDPQGPKVNLVDQPKGSPGQTTTYTISYNVPTATPTPTGSRPPTGTAAPTNTATNTSTCGNGIVESGEQCDDGNLTDGDGCNADCTWTGLLPEIDDTPPAPGKSDSASLTCMKSVGDQVRTYASAVYDQLRACVGAMQEYHARVAAGLPATQLAAALATARKQCVEPSATAPDTKTPLGKLETARVKAISAVEKKCGTPGQTALDGKTIGKTASADFTPAEITEHIGWARCQAEELFGRGYATAAPDLHTFTARDSQGGQTLDTYFPCLSAADLPAMDYTPSAPGKKDSASVACQKAVGTRIGGYGSIQGYARTRHLLLRSCLDALLAHEAAVTAGRSATKVQALLNTARKQCVEPSATAPDSKTLLGKLEAARVNAIAAIEKKCGTPGQTALDGKLIGTGASSDLTEAQISTHAETAACRVDDVVSRGYNGAADLLATMTARPSQGGAPLDTYFACLLR